MNECIIVFIYLIFKIAFIEPFGQSIERKEPTSSVLILIPLLPLKTTDRENVFQGRRIYKVPITPSDRQEAYYLRLTP